MTQTKPDAHAEMWSRIKRVFSVGILVNGFTLLSSLVLPPYFIHELGVERYGAWLYLFSIPMSLNMFDGGISAAFSTEVYRLHAVGQKELAASTFKAGLKLLAKIVGCAMCILSVGVLAFSPTAVSVGEGHAAIFFLGLYALVGFFSELLSSPYKIAGRFHLVQLNGLLNKVLEMVALLTLLRFNNFVLLAIALLSLRIFSAVLMFFHVRHFAPYLLAGSWRERPPVRHLLSPSIMYALGPLMMFISLQLPLVVIGNILGMALVVAYTTTRTMVRLPLQVSNQISMSLYTEYTRLCGRGEWEVVNRLFRKSSILILSLLVSWVIVASLAGPSVYRLWLNHEPLYFHLFFIALSIEAVFEALMRNRVALTSSMNRHQRDVIFQLLTVSCSVAALYGVGSFSGNILYMLIASSCTVAVAGGMLFVAAFKARPPLGLDL